MHFVQNPYITIPAKNRVNYLSVYKNTILQKNTLKCYDFHICWKYPKGTYGFIQYHNY